MTPKQAQFDIGKVKEELISIYWKLRDEHFEREARSLDCLVAKLEALQNNPNWRQKQLSRAGRNSSKKPYLVKVEKGIKP